MKYGSNISYELCALVLILCLLAAGVVIGLFRRHQRSRLQRDREEQRHHALAEHIEYLTRYANDIILLYDDRLRIIEANERALESYGYSHEEITLMSLADLRCNDLLPDITDWTSRIREKGGMIYESLHCRKDKSLFPVEISVRFIEIDRKPFFQAIIRDITDRKRAEERIDRLSSLYRVLSQANQAIIHTGKRDELFAEICRIIVDNGRLLMAWVGLLDPAGRVVVPIAFAGCERGYLEDIVISSDDVPEGRGPTGTAIRERRHVISPDIEEDPIMLPWRERALARGYRSSAAFPLYLWEECVGALMVYAPAPNFFDEEIVVLLDELSANLSHAMGSMEQAEALEINRERLSLALKSSAMGTWDWDINSNLIVWDEFLHMLFGVDPGSFPGRADDLIALVHPEDRERTMEELKHVMREGSDFESNYRIIKPDGNISYIATRGKVYHDELGSPSRMAGVCWDVTKRRQEAQKLQQQKELLQAIVDTIPVMLCYFDSDGSLKWVNPEWERILGWSFGERNPEQILEKCYPDTGYRRLVLESVETADGKWRDFITMDRNGRSLDTTWATVRLSDGTSISIGQDITERKLAEKEILKLNAELEGRVRERTAQLEEANRELEAFSYSVSHDLRAPLRAIGGFSGIILDKCSDALDDEGRRLLNVIIDNTRKMRQLIDNLLSFSRMGRTEILRSRIDMTRLVHSVMTEIVGHDPEGKIDIRLLPLEDSSGDQAMIRQVWLNLFSNALKFTMPRDRSVIEVGGWSVENENVYYIKDNGVGFDEENVHKLFRIFQRLHAGSDFEGTGVGLAIVHRIVSRHGGRVWAEGKEGEGATFYFTLPRTIRDE